MIKKFVEERHMQTIYIAIIYDPKYLINFIKKLQKFLSCFNGQKIMYINKDKLGELKDEIAEGILLVILLADHFDINLDEALDSKILKNIEKYPVDKSKVVSDKYTEL